MNCGKKNSNWIKKNKELSKKNDSLLVHIKMIDLTQTDTKEAFFRHLKEKDKIIKNLLLAENTKVNF